MPITQNGDGQVIYTAPIKERQFEETGAVDDIDFSIIDSNNALKQIKFEVNPLSPGAGAATIRVGISSDAVIDLTGGVGGNSFTTIQPDSGTSPTASSPTDTLTLHSGSTPLHIAGDATSKTITYTVDTASASQPGVLSAADWTTFNGKGAGTVTSVSVTTANGVSGSVATATSTPAITLTLGAITPSSVAASGNVTGSNLSGTNTGDVTLAAVGSSPNDNAASIASQVLTLQPASASKPGVVISGTQTLGGAKTFDTLVTAPGVQHNGTGGAGYAEFVQQSSSASTPTNGYRLFADSTDRFSWRGANGFNTVLSSTGNSADRVYTLQDATMTVAGTAATLGGTAQTTYTKGDLLYSSASNTLSKLGIGTGDQLLKVDPTNGIPAWVNFFDPTRTMRIYEDFLVDSAVGSTRWSSTSSGTGSNAGITNANSDSSHPGVAVLSTGTTSTGWAGANLGTVPGFIFGNGVTTIQWLIYIDTLSDATNEYRLRVGTGDALATTDTIVDGVYLNYERTTSANWIMVASSNSTKTSTTSSTAVAAGAWTNIKIVVNAAGTSAEYFVNGASLGTVTTNIPTAASRCSNPIAIIGKSAGTTSRSIYLDYAFFECYFTTSR